jgi:drug/metabolite transporter (DMT)-like permease
MYLEIAGKLLSESLLSLYPVFVKNIDLSLPIQLWSRFITYVLISGFFIDWSFVLEHIFSSNGLLLSGTTLIHVITSYRGFQLLDSGIAWSLFYIYPLFILLFSGQSIPPLLLLAPLGVILLTTQKSASITKSKHNEKFRYEGILMILSAALTEAIIYFLVRRLKTPNNWNHLFISYGLGMIFLSIFGFRELGSLVSSKYSTFSWSLVLNSIIGLFGYYFRFFAATRLDPVVYAPLSYFGIIMAFVYGYVFNREKITWLQVVGLLLCIIPSVHQVV